MKSEEGIREQKEYYCSLFTIYGNLLTDTIKRRMSYFYLEDYSLSEISQLEKVSRNAVFLSIRQGKKELKEYDGKLGFSLKRGRIQSLLDKRKEETCLENRKKEIEDIEGELENGI